MFKSLRKFFEKVAGNWDGDNPGTMEERAQFAEEGLDLLDKLQKIVDYFNLE